MRPIDAEAVAELTEAPVAEQLVIEGRGGVAVEVHPRGVFGALHKVVILAPEAEIGAEPLGELQLAANHA